MATRDELEAAALRIKQTLPEDGTLFLGVLISTSKDMVLSSTMSNDVALSLVKHLTKFFAAIKPRECEKCGRATRNDPDNEAGAVLCDRCDRPSK